MGSGTIIKNNVTPSGFKWCKSIYCCNHIIPLGFWKVVFGVKIIYFNALLQS